MRHRKSDGNRVIRAVDQVGTVTRGQAHGEQSERIVRTRRHGARKGIPRFGMFLANRFRRKPNRILLFPNHMGEPERCAPIHLADADWVGNDLDRAAAFRLWVVIQPVLGKIDDDSLARPRRQNMTVRNHEGFVGAGQPGVDAGIDPDQFLGTQTELAREIIEGVLVHRHDGFVFAHHGIVTVRERVQRRPRGLAARERQKAG